MEILDQKRTGRTGLGQIQVQIHLGGQGRVGGSRARVDEAEGGRKGRARGLRRDAGVLRDAPRALAVHPHEQRHRAAPQGETGRNREIRRVPASSALSPSALMLVAACLKYVADNEWGSRRYLNASLINE